MVFKGRTVFAIVLLALLAGSLFTMAVTDSPIWEKSPSQASNPSPSSTPGASSSTAGDDKLSGEELDKVERAYELIETNFLSKVDKDKIVNGAIHGMLDALDDPYTTYMDQEEAKQFEETINSSFQGIGAECSLVNGVVTVTAPIKGSPAEKAGIRTGDAILAVNGEKLDGLTLNQAVMKIRGPKGTQAKLTILKAGASAPQELVVVRDDIPIETVYAEMVNDTIGKIEISQFSTDTAKRFAEELNNLEKKGMKGLIIDVRDDPGGLLDSVLDIADHFVPKGKTVLQVEDRNGQRSEEAAKGKYPVRTYPVTVMINGGSASASEILAGIIKEAVGGQLVGEKSFGKGTVQVTYEKEMGDGSNIKMTIMKWLTPNGNWIHKKGIEPDIKVEQPAVFNLTAFSKEKTLKADMVGDEVKKLQVMLAALGFAPDRQDGYFSKGTADKVKAFQTAKKLTVTGEADAKTMSGIEEAVTAMLRDSKNDAQLNAAITATEKRLGK
ncbi:S41 family peptidase [Gorillibacterium timonense]|uniref:S41 family peptidase n=1 Tax=Gorillibacterium timonense TaxID=1689269 RepID=UPI00071C941F|nr:S41 family peptidase [Gorillibacterium timonense]